MIKKMLWSSNDLSYQKINTASDIKDIKDSLKNRGIIHVFDGSSPLEFLVVLDYFKTTVNYSVTTVICIC